MDAETRPQWGSFGDPTRTDEMVTTAKRWPKRAEAARQESLAAAREIVSLGREVKQRIQERQYGLALSLVSEMQLAAKDIEMELRLVKSQE